MFQQCYTKERILADNYLTFNWFCPIVSAPAQKPATFMNINPLVHTARWVFVAQTPNRQGRFYASGERLQLLIGDDGKDIWLAGTSGAQINLFISSQIKGYKICIATWTYALQRYKVL